MKIIYYSPHPTHDIVSEVGYATHQRETILALEKRGHIVIKVIMGGTTADELPFAAGKAVESGGVKKWIKKIIPKILWITLKDIKLLKHDRNAALKLEHAIVKHNPDLIYERSEILQNASVKIIKKYKIPYFLEVNAPFVEEMASIEGKSLLHGLARSKEQSKLRAADHIFVVSSALKAYIHEEYKIEKSKIAIAPNRINIANFNFDENQSNGVFTYGFVGSILPFHKVKLLLLAFEQVFKKTQDCRLLIVGEGSERVQLEELSCNMGLKNAIEFTGSVKHKVVWKQISRMHVCIMPGTNWYGSPVKIFEYGAMKKPIIAPNKAPLQDVIEHGVDGLLIEETVEDLCNAMLEIKENYQTALKRAEHFYTKILNQYCWEHAAIEIENLYTRA